MVAFTLTKPGQATLQVRSLSGQVVRSMEYAGRVGLNVFVWDGRDDAGRRVPNGTYLIDLSVQGEEGEMARSVRTVVWW
jgi:flagellar hook assembly protein FlgD